MKCPQSCDSDTKGGPRQHSSQLEEGEILNSSDSSKACPSPGTSSGRKSGDYHGPHKDSNEGGSNHKGQGQTSPSQGIK